VFEGFSCFDLQDVVHAWFGRVWDPRLFCEDPVHAHSTRPSASLWTLGPPRETNIGLCGTAGQICSVLSTGNLEDSS
jgi:hypothetical protein